MTRTSRTTKVEQVPQPAKAPAESQAERHAPTYDLLLDGRPLATDLLPTTVEDLLKLDATEVAWALEEHGVCSVCDASGERELVLVERCQQAKET